MQIEGSIESLQQQIDSLEGHKKNLEAEVANLSKQLEESNQALAAEQVTANALRADVRNMKEF